MTDWHNAYALLQSGKCQIRFTEPLSEMVPRSVLSEKSNLDTF